MPRTEETPSTTHKNTILEILFYAFLGAIVSTAMSIYLYEPATSVQTQRCERAGKARACLLYSARPVISFGVSSGCTCLTRDHDKLTFTLEENQ